MEKVNAAHRQDELVSEGILAMDFASAIGDGHGKAGEEEDKKRYDGSEEWEAELPGDTDSGVVEAAPKP